MPPYYIFATLHRQASAPQLDAEEFSGLKAMAEREAADEKSEQNKPGSQIPEAGSCLDEYHS